MSDFLLNTLTWTGVLLALVLLIRRPVAQMFGPKAAYALWALPMARLVLPPIVLPGWMAPAPDLNASEPAVAMAQGFSGLPLDTFADAPAATAAPAAIDWSGLLLTVWLAGAAIFLVRRYALYFQMRRELLEGARPVGEAGRVRLVETPGADGPVAFGVLDKVVALPLGFMAGQDRVARDLALAHELAHHRGRDLACNMLVQPLFALHWFNPLSILGWRALRRDQEAACDARVIAQETRERRAAYAAVIARFATQPNHAARLALAAPMACPVLGDRSIVQRLKSLAMDDISVRRRWAGRLFILTTALALPLTGSISYARSEMQGETVSPPEAVAPVAPPAAPSQSASPQVTSHESVRTVQVNRSETRRPANSDSPVTLGDTVVIRDGTAAQTGVALATAGRAERAQDMVWHRRDMQAYEREMFKYRNEMAKHQRYMAEQARDQQEHARDMAEMERDLAREMAEIEREVRGSVAVAVAAPRAAALAVARAPRVTMRCRDGQTKVSETVISGGQQQIFVCSALATKEAKLAIASVRVDIKRSSDMGARARAEALRSLDEAEASLDAN